MKIKQFIIVVVILLTANSNAQIKVFSGGSVTIGATTSPTANSVNHQIIGAKTVFPSSTSAITSAPLIRGSNGYSSASAPDFTWHGDNTGIFHPASGILAFAAGGFEAFRINASKQILSKQQASDASTPEYSWDTDPNTGIIRPGNDQIALVTAGTERMRITGNGNLLIGGTTDVGPRLVNTGASDQIALSNYVTHTGNYGYCQINWVNRSLTKAYSVISSASGSNVENFVVWGNGDCWNINNIHTSDKNLKENIDSLTNALTKVKQLKGVNYNFKASFIGNDFSSRKEVGLIAQDVEQIIPEVVVTNDKGMKGIKYANIIAYLIEAIKEQDKQINKLQNDINSCCNKSDQRINNVIDTGTNDTNSESYTGSSYIKQNIPNPFSKETRIDYFINEKNASASILVFDMNGKLLKTFKLNGSGKGDLTISGNEFSPGMYYYSLIVNAKEVGTKKMILTE